MVYFECEEKIAQICEWRLDLDDNIVHALLSNNLDEIAISFMGAYSKFMDANTFLFTLDNRNHLFLKKALAFSAFDKTIFREKIVIAKLMSTLDDGSKINFVVNIFALIDVAIWKNKTIQDVLDIFRTFCEENQNKNIMMLCHNPI